MSVRGDTVLASRLSLTAFEITRRWPDGLIEVQLPNGRKWRGLCFRCLECEHDLPGFMFSWLKAYENCLKWGDHYKVIKKDMFICDDCMRRFWRQKEAKQLQDIKQFKFETAKTPLERRGILISLAAVSWRDKNKIRAIYSEARRLTAETGIKHEVDHIYPLQGKWCCGLHVETNLRIITEKQNRKKRHKMPMKNSPALKLAREEIVLSLDEQRGQMISDYISSTNCEKP